MASSPAYAKHPEHQIEVEINPGRVRAEFSDETIADSVRALRVLESHHDAVLYFPREDVQTLLIEKTAHTTFCPFKGTASYWSIRVGDHVAENAIWSYEEPYDEVATLRGAMAFYVERIDALREG